MRAFCGQLQRQTFGFLQKGTTPAAPVAPPSAEDSAAKNAAFQLQLRALKEIWGDRLVLLYRFYITRFGQGDRPDRDDAVLRAARSVGVRVLNLHPALLRQFQEFRPPRGFRNSLLGQGHLNAHGHAIVAAELVKFLESHSGIF